VAYGKLQQISHSLTVQQQFFMVAASENERSLLLPELTTKAEIGLCHV
jgi:hypothetical protein